jgi:hypothetical protein
MVIASDITRWGFTRGDDVEGDVKVGFDKIVLTFSNPPWMIFMDKSPLLKGIPSKKVAIFFEGRKQEEAFLISPNGVFGFLKKVGYLK